MPLLTTMPKASLVGSQAAPCDHLRKLTMAGFAGSVTWKNAWLASTDAEPGQAGRPVTKPRSWPSFRGGT